MNINVIGTKARPDSPVGYTLMRKDNQVARFLWMPSANKVTTLDRVYSEQDAPFGCRDNTGRIARGKIQSWLQDRSIPTLRDGVAKRLEDIMIDSTSELMAMSLGLSLSDHYWIKPDGLEASWDEINYFENDFSPLLGELLLPHDDSSMPEIRNRAISSKSLLGRSPDPALNGNLPKKWLIRNGVRILCKGGHERNRHQEPFNEKIASRLCSRILEPGDYVPYELEVNGYLKYLSLCPNMASRSVELVPAYQLHGTDRRLNHESQHAYYLRLLNNLGIDGAIGISKMLTVDFLMANFDRHWNNFGILLDSDSRVALGVAPIYDTGESLWCDRDIQQGFSGYRFGRDKPPRPFIRDLDNQLARFAGKLDWLDTDALTGFPEEACEILSLNPLVANEPGRLEEIEASLFQRIESIKQRIRMTHPVIPTTSDLKASLELLKEKKGDAIASHPASRNQPNP